MNGYLIFLWKDCHRDAHFEFCLSDKWEDVSVRWLMNTLLSNLITILLTCLHFYHLIRHWESVYSYDVLCWNYVNPDWFSLLNTVWQLSSIFHEEYIQCSIGEDTNITQLDTMLIWFHFQWPCCCQSYNRLWQLYLVLLLQPCHSACPHWH